MRNRPAFGRLQFAQHRLSKPLPDSPAGRSPSRPACFAGVLAAGVVWLLFLGACHAPAADRMRTWTDVSGNYHLEAELVGVRDGFVTLRKANGTLVKLTEEQFVRNFSEADRNYVARWALEEIQRQQTAADQPAQDDSRQAPQALQYGRARRLCYLSDERISESSGVACSRRAPGVFWTHNDSGDEARLYAFDKRGRTLGACTLKGVLAFDWEDIASFSLEGQHYLLVGDVGNNGRAAGVHMLYLIHEPNVEQLRPDRLLQVPVLQLVNFAYEDDHRNCEALAVDPATRTVLLATKERLFGCLVYSLPWPKDDPKKVHTARKIATLMIPPATGMDISPDGHRAVVVTYGNAYQFTRAPGESWAQAFARRPVEIVLPARAQGEAICYGADGKTLYLTSENLPAPLWEVPVE